MDEDVLLVKALRSGSKSDEKVSLCAFVRCTPRLALLILTYIFSKCKRFQFNTQETALKAPVASKELSATSSNTKVADEGGFVNGVIVKVLCSGRNAPGGDDIGSALKLEPGINLMVSG